MLLRPTMILRAVNGRSGNITGFDVRKLKEAIEKPRYDPWERYEDWRYTGLFSRWNRFKNSFPGLGIATVAFAAYCGYEYAFLQDEHHDEHHGEGHH
ncbi:putative nadh-ubiquinone oxidoreductase b12 [Diaporthe ampelina]|uniref:Putative nadh-ubiquinone oxidoreductase b12 n=1 Tax=Diaporthe ampelina TaxID=1214573 RepID=A0A0G2HFF5_9PEZI|nr:putative nadh-ubiquinone oxidoreductase b12 [Diaporthe ampelina]